MDKNSVDYKRQLNRQNDHNLIIDLSKNMRKFLVLQLRLRINETRTKNYACDVHGISHQNYFVLDIILQNLIDFDTFHLFYYAKL